MGSEENFIVAHICLETTAPAANASRLKAHVGNTAAVASQAHTALSLAGIFVAPWRAVAYVSNLARHTIIYYGVESLLRLIQYKLTFLFGYQISLRKVGYAGS